MMDYYAIGQRIRTKRRERGLLQEALAGAAGISVTHVSHIETGSTKLSLPVLAALAEALGVQVDALLYLLDEEVQRDVVIEEMVQMLGGCTHQLMCEVLKATEDSLQRYF